MSKLAKILSLALALTMLAGVALGEGSQLAAEAQTEVDTEAYEVTSAEVYQAVLGDFYQIYMAAKDPAITVSERYAKMAIAEAKLMGSAVMIPWRAAAASTPSPASLPGPATPPCGAMTPTACISSSS